MTRKECHNKNCKYKFRVFHNIAANEQGLAFVATDLSVSPATEAWFYCIVQI